MSAEISGSKLVKSLSDRLRNTAGFHQLRHVRMHVWEDANPTDKTQGIPLKNPWIV